MGRHPTSDAKSRTQPRRLPSQKRSRARVERILAAAKRLIEEKGSDALRMGEVAEQAEISIGSLYQYFPDKAAIIHSLAERYNAEGRACIETALAAAYDLADLGTAFSDLVDTYFALFQAEPVMRDIWSGVQADQELRELDLEDSRETGRLLADALLRLMPDADAAAVETKAFLIMHLGEATMRLAISLDRKEGAALVAAYKRMALRELQSDIAPAGGCSEH